MRGREGWRLAVAVGLLSGVAAAADTLLDLGDMGHSKEPVTSTAERLEYDYKANVVVYRGAVEAVQGAAKLRSDTLTVRLLREPATPNPAPAAAPAPNPSDGAPSVGAGGGSKVQEIVAVGNVRIDQGTRWATGGRGVFDQTLRTFVLTESPVLHDGPNEVAGDRVTVFLDENRSVVDGGASKRVKAVIHPNNNDKDKDTQPPAAPVANAERAAGAKVLTP